MLSDKLGHLIGILTFLLFGNEILCGGAVCTGYATAVTTLCADSLQIVYWAIQGNKYCNTQILQGVDEDQ